MLLICQLVLSSFSGSQPSFRATFACDGTPPAPSCASVSRVLGRISSRSRASWSLGVVVLSPHPGQGKSGHCTHEDGSVWVSPAEVLNDAISEGPPTASQRLVAESLSLSSIMLSASEVSLDESSPEPVRCWAYS